MEDEQQRPVTQYENEKKGNQINDPDPAQAETTEHGEKKSLTQIAAEESEDFSNEKYACDRQFAVTLAQLMAAKDREKVYRWVERLDTMNDCDEIREERDKYLKFLTLSVSNAKLVPPFNKLPPPGLRPLSTIMPRSFYNLIYKDKYETCQLTPSMENATPEKKFSQPDLIDPTQFFSRQPTPHKGGFVYAVAFSQKK